jgi:FKBP-type peptidyl-prolyl cis-trans isomerase (trigger factor)
LSVAVAPAAALAALSTTLVAASAVDQSEEELERQLSELRARKTHKKTESRGADVGAVEDFLANFKA